METPTNLMTITAALCFDELPPWDDVVRLLEARLLSHERFRQRVVPAPLGVGVPRWRRDPAFDLAAHLHRAAVPGNGGAEGLRTILSDLMSTPLDPSKPLWQIHVLEDRRGGGALVARIQHCVADGVALIRLLHALSDEGAALPGAAPRELPERSGAHLLDQGLELARHPASVVGAAKLGARSVTALGETVLLAPDPPTGLKGPLGRTKRCAWSRPIELSRLKAIGREFGATVNDVLMAATTGSIRSYLAEHGNLRPELRVRAIVPVDLRRTPLEKLGNQFGLVFVPLPAGVEPANERLRLVKADLDEIKRSPEARVILQLLGLAGFAGAAVEHVLLRFFGSKASLVVTNVPGPKEPLSFGGKRIRQILVWVPQSARLGLGISLLSYAGAVTFGVASDARLIPNPEEMVTAFETELDALEEPPGPTGSAYRARDSSPRGAP